MTDTKPLILKDNADVTHTEIQDGRLVKRNLGKPLGGGILEDTPVGDYGPGMVENGSPTMEVIIPQPGQVVDVSVPGVVLRFGDVHFLAVVALQALANAGKHSTGALPMIGDIKSEQEYREAMAAGGVTSAQLYDGTLPLMEEQVWGYKREGSEDTLPSLEVAPKIPILSGINEIAPLPRILDPVVKRVFDEEAKQGPRLLACTPPNTPMPSRCYVAEFPPTSVLSRIGEKYYQLNTPYVIAALVPAFNTLYLRCRPRPTAAGDEMTYHFPFPHIDKDAKVCLHAAGASEFSRKDPLDAMVAYVTSYWQSGYRYYLCANGLPAVPEETNARMGVGGEANVETVFAWWERQSFEGILQLKYVQAETVTQFAERIFATRVGRTQTRFKLEMFLDENAAAAADARANEAAHEIQEYAQVYRQ